MDLVELMASFRACSPKTALTAAVSILSLSGVEVPWALMYWTTSGGTPASSRARRMTRMAPSPSSAGAAAW